LDVSIIVRNREDNISVRQLLSSRNKNGNHSKQNVFNVRKEESVSRVKQFYYFTANF